MNESNGKKRSTVFRNEFLPSFRPWLTYIYLTQSTILLEPIEKKNNHKNRTFSRNFNKTHIKPQTHTPKNKGSITSVVHISTFHNENFNSMQFLERFK